MNQPNQPTNPEPMSPVSPVNPDPKAHPIHAPIPEQPIHEGTDPTAPVTETEPRTATT